MRRCGDGQSANICVVGGVTDDQRTFASMAAIAINRRPTASRPFSGRWRTINRERSRTRACSMHAFRVVKQLWGFIKVRYCGWQRIWHGRRPSSRWPISTRCAANCSRQSEVRVVNLIDQTRHANDHCSAANNRARCRSFPSERSLVCRIATP
jgi:hypothetical protein